MEAFERNVSSPECECATNYDKVLPASREPEVRRQRSEDGDKKQKPGPTGLFVRRGAQNSPAQPEAEEPGELQ